MPEMWEALQNIPHMNFNPAVAADSSTNNAGISNTLSSKSYVRSYHSIKLTEMFLLYSAGSMKIEQ
jgi:hypothetical protein